MKFFIMRIENNFVRNVRKKLEKEISLISYLDLSNMFHWQKVLKWQFRIEDVISELFSIKGMKAVKIYFGLDEKNLIKSKAFHKRILKTGATLITKKVKYIKKSIIEASLFKPRILSLFDKEIQNKLNELAEQIQFTCNQIEEAKCNFDVEITMDILDDINKFSGILLFSGDSDFYAPLMRAKLKNKRVFVVGVRGQTSKELFSVCDYFINFGYFYRGKKEYKKAKIPPMVGPREV